MSSVSSTAKAVLILAVAASCLARVCGLDVVIDDDMAKCDAEYDGECTNFPFNSDFHDQKLQTMYLASELQEAGIVHGQQITAVSLKCAELPDEDVENFRIAFVNVQASPWASDVEVSRSYSDGDPPGTFQQSTVVFGPERLPTGMFTVNEWLQFNLTEPIPFNKNKNLVLEFSSDSSAYGDGFGGVMMSGRRPWRTISGASDSDYGPYPFDSMHVGFDLYLGVIAVTLSVEPCIPLCGNGVVDCVEECDDNNTLSGDGCSSSCMHEAGWSCSEQAAAPTVCQQCFCGNGMLECEERCDDGNMDNGDG